MKPSNEIERRMVALAGKLPPVTARQKKYAYLYCFSPRSVYWPRKRQMRCLCCGRTYDWEKFQIESFAAEDEYICPSCGRTTTVERYTPACITREHKHFTVITTFRGYQVARTFEVSRCNYANDSFARYSIDEIYQIWILEDGKEVITGRRLHRSVFSEIWDFHLPYDIRHHNASSNGCYNFDDIYNICGNELYPDVRVTKLVRRNGWRKDLLTYRNMISMTDAMQWILTVPTAEMLVKTGQMDLFIEMIRSGKKDLPLHAVRIANRHGYVVRDASMWIDMLSMAQTAGLDTHNPQVVCPPDLKEAHDRIRARVVRIQERQRKEKAIWDAVKWEEEYSRDKGKYFGVSFSNGTITVSVIGSVAEMSEEGNAMHHCVYNAGYYKRPDSLIMSARDQSGRRIETIELSLRTFNVVQSRAKFNGTAPEHDEILELVNNNINLIKQVSREM